MDLIPIEEKITELHNAELVQITNCIYYIAQTIRREFYRISALLAEVDEKQLYIEDGFKSTVDYSMKVFGLRKTDAYNLLTIGKEYTNMAEKNQSNLPRDDPKSDFTKSQIVAMLPLGHETAEDLAKAGTITPGTSVRKIKEVVRNNRAANAIINGDPDEEDPKPGEGAAREDLITWSIEEYTDGQYNIKGIVPEMIMEAVRRYYGGK